MLRESYDDVCSFLACVMGLAFLRMFHVKQTVRQKFHMEHIYGIKVALAL
jgi:hypothetical protein